MGTPLTFKMTVGGGSKTATGSITLLDGSSQVTQQSLDSTGSAVFNTSSLNGGVHTLTANYAGDTNYAPATSANISQSVTDLQIAATTSSQTVTGGSTANYSLTVTPEAGFTGTVKLACSGLPSLATCSTPPVQVGAGAVTFTVAVATVASMTAMAGRAGETLYGGLLLGCFSLYRLANKPKGSAKWLAVLCPLFLFVLLFTATGCGGGGSKQTIPGTPNGTSTVTITATVTQNGLTVTHSAAAALVVQ